VPTVKELVRSLTLPVARQVAEQVLALKTTAEVRDYLTRRVKQICPNVALFDTTQ
jgi:phosphoenolpyruvate-protein kinase (PTS system EI component)